ncbi:hypothetical protein PV327_005616 [Microctonus hyperodae]|uniref:M-phase phosphoprotein 6 n=1 Tax=Microctonus hyperodae TaxID=165561 RepID=A0AA39G213_MICHY|nr:hypothetical protein PV327_005616 [Microctonus hyperodae]
MDRTTGKTELSRSILDMKFMRKTKEKVEQQTFQSQGEEYFENALTARMKKESGLFIIEPSYAICEQLTDGRFSFQGMNPEIEKLMQLEENMKRMKEEAKHETEVSDEQMAKRWQGSHIQTMNKRFQTKKNRRFNAKQPKDENEPKPKKLKFLKPSD